MNRFFFPAILFIAMFFVGLSVVSTPVDAALDIHSGYANDWRQPQGDELPYTYGEAIVENMWTSGPWAYSTHSLFIGNYAGGPFGPQDINFNITYVCELKGTNRLERIHEPSVKELDPYYNGHGWEDATWSDNNRQLSIRRGGLEAGVYTFTAYTELDAWDVDRARSSNMACGIFNAN